MACGLVLLTLAVPAKAATGGAQPDMNSFGSTPTGGATVVAHANVKPAPRPVRPLGRIAVAPAGAPAAVRHAITEANAIVGLPYRWGGGHRSFRSRGYDCSGAVSYLLHGGGLLASPLDSSSFMRWGARGPGRWITVYTNPAHAFVEVAGEDAVGAVGPHPPRSTRSRPGGAP